MTTSASTFDSNHIHLRFKSSHPGMPDIRWYLSSTGCYTIIKVGCFYPQYDVKNIQATSMQVVLRGWLTHNDVRKCKIISTRTPLRTLISIIVQVLSTISSLPIILPNQLQTSIKELNWSQVYYFYEVL